MHGINEEGELVGLHEGNRLLEALGIQSCLQASTLTPLKTGEQTDRSGQRSLLLAVSASIVQYTPPVAALNLKSLVEFRTTQNEL